MIHPFESPLTDLSRTSTQIISDVGLAVPDANRSRRRKRFRANTIGPPADSPGGWTSVVRRVSNRHYGRCFWGAISRQAQLDLHYFPANTPMHRVIKGNRDVHNFTISEAAHKVKLSLKDACSLFEVVIEVVIEY